LIKRSFQELSIAIKTMRIVKELMEIWPNEVCDSPTSLLIDNQGALDLIRSGQINNHMKHIDIKFRHVCDQED